MFLENKSHMQQDLFGIESQLSKSKRKKLRSSSYAFFYELIYCNIKENDFAVLFSDKGSRPNAPVNALVSALILYLKKGWTTEDLFERIDFDLRTRTALGLHNLEDTPFCPATFFNFQNRLLNHFVTTGENLIEKIFDSLTEAQLKKLKIKTDIQRMDSFQAMSNIRAYSRTQLLVEVLIRVYRVLSDSDKRNWKDTFTPYVKNTSSAFVYGLNKSDIPHELQKIADMYHGLYELLKSSYRNTEIFEIFERVFNEHFCIVADKITVRDSRELTSSSLQSPDDIDATFRTKRGDNYRGQVVNITETANPENALNLITDVAVEPNNTDDSTILNNRIDEIKKKCDDLNEMHTDGGYGSSDNDKKMDTNKINHIQTAARGRVAEVPMKIKRTDDEHYQVSCPQQTVQSQETKTRLKACFDLKVCSKCQHTESCPAIIQNNYRVFYFTHEMVKMQERTHAIELLPPERRKIRPNIEATVKEYTMAFNHKGKLRLRGKFKTILFAFAMSIGINFGRIFRHLMANPDLIPSLARICALFSAVTTAVDTVKCKIVRCVVAFYAKNFKEPENVLFMSIYAKSAF
ncbi:DDE transposase [Candidatus Peregrinibacteria bacterium]|nr:DDE transposase [Candidatus Peregrinibacteria bacterium]